MVDHGSEPELRDSLAHPHESSGQVTLDDLSLVDDRPSDGQVANERRREEVDRVAAVLPDVVAVARPEAVVGASLVFRGVHEGTPGRMTRRVSCTAAWISPVDNAMQRSMCA